MSLTKDQIEDYLIEHLKDYEYDVLKKQLIKYGAIEKDVEEVYSNIKHHRLSTQSIPLPPKRKKPSSSINVSSYLGPIIMVFLALIVLGGGVLLFVFPSTLAVFILSEEGDFSGYFSLDKSSTFDNETLEVTVVLQSTSNQELLLYERDSKNILILEDLSSCPAQSTTLFPQDTSDIGSIEGAEEEVFGNASQTQRGAEITVIRNGELVVQNGDVLRFIFECDNQNFDTFLRGRVTLNLLEVESQEEIYLQNSDVVIEK